MRILVAQDVEILKRVILKDRSELPEAVAREFLDYQFDEADRKRMRLLSEKARQGALTPEEAFEAEGFERVGSLLGILQSKARRSLQRSNPAP